jgi:hypothetical protein
MSFGPSNTAKAASNNLAGISDTALNKQLPMFNAYGSDALNTGQQNTASGTNFFNTLLNGNQADTTALLQPDINRIKQANQQSLTASSTLMPRGGGRAGSLFSSTYAPNAQIQSLFNGARGSAAQPLINAGLQQQGIGTNLFGLGNQALNTATGANKDQLDYQLAQQKLTNSMWSSLGSGILGLATMPIGGSSLLGGLGGLFKGAGGGGGFVDG